MHQKCPKNDEIGWGGGAFSLCVSSVVPPVNECEVFLYRNSAQVILLELPAEVLGGGVPYKK